MLRNLVIISMILMAQNGGILRLLGGEDGQKNLTTNKSNTKPNQSAVKSRIHSLGEPKVQERGVLHNDPLTIVRNEIQQEHKEGVEVLSGIRKPRYQKSQFSRKSDDNKMAIMNAFKNQVKNNFSIAKMRAKANELVKSHASNIIVALNLMPYSEITPHLLTIIKDLNRYYVKPRKNSKVDECAVNMLEALTSVGKIRTIKGPLKDVTEEDGENCQVEQAYRYKPFRMIKFLQSIDKCIETSSNEFLKPFLNIEDNLKLVKEIINTRFCFKTNYYEKLRVTPHKEFHFDYRKHTPPKRQFKETTFSKHRKRQDAIKDRNVNINYRLQRKKEKLRNIKKKQWTKVKEYINDFLVEIPKSNSKLLLDLALFLRKYSKFDLRKTDPNLRKKYRSFAKHIMALWKTHKELDIDTERWYSLSYAFKPYYRKRFLNSLRYMIDFLSTLPQDNDQTSKILFLLKDIETYTVETIYYDNHFYIELIKKIYKEKKKEKSGSRERAQNFSDNVRSGSLKKMNLSNVKSKIKDDIDEAMRDWNSKYGKDKDKPNIPKQKYDPVIPKSENQPKDRISREGSLEGFKGTNPPLLKKQNILKSKFDLKDPVQKLAYKTELYKERAQKIKEKPSLAGIKKSNSRPNSQVNDLKDDNSMRSFSGFQPDIDNMAPFEFGRKDDELVKDIEAAKLELETSAKMSVSDEDSHLGDDEEIFDEESDEDVNNLLSLERRKADKKLRKQGTGEFEEDSNDPEGPSHEDPSNQSQDDEYDSQHDEDEDENQLHEPEYSEDDEVLLESQVKYPEQIMKQNPLNFDFEDIGEQVEDNLMNFDENDDDLMNYLNSGGQDEVIQDQNSSKQHEDEIQDQNSNEQHEDEIQITKSPKKQDISESAQELVQQKQLSEEETDLLNFDMPSEIQSKEQSNESRKSIDIFPENNDDEFKKATRNFDDLDTIQGRQNSDENSGDEFQNKNDNPLVKPLKKEQPKQSEIPIEGESFLLDASKKSGNDLDKTYAIENTQKEEPTLSDLMGFNQKQDVEQNSMITDEEQEPTSVENRKKNPKKLRNPNGEQQESEDENEPESQGISKVQIFNNLWPIVKRANDLIPRSVLIPALEDILESLYPDLPEIIDESKQFDLIEIINLYQKYDQILDEVRIIDNPEHNTLNEFKYEYPKDVFENFALAFIENQENSLIDTEPLQSALKNLNYDEDQTYFEDFSTVKIFPLNYDLEANHVETNLKESKIVEFVSYINDTIKKYPELSQDKSFKDASDNFFRTVAEFSDKRKFRKHILKKMQIGRYIYAKYEVDFLIDSINNFYKVMNISNGYPGSIQTELDNFEKFIYDLNFNGNFYFDEIYKIHINEETPIKEKGGIDLDYDYVRKLLNNRMKGSVLLEPNFKLIDFFLADGPTVIDGAMDPILEKYFKSLINLINNRSFTQQIIRKRVKRGSYVFPNEFIEDYHQNLTKSLNFLRSSNELEASIPANDLDSMESKIIYDFVKTRANNYEVIFEVGVDEQSPLEPIESYIDPEFTDIDESKLVNLPDMSYAPIIRKIKKKLPFSKLYEINEFINNVVEENGDLKNDKEFRKLTDDYFNSLSNLIEWSRLVKSKLKNKERISYVYKPEQKEDLEIKSNLLKEFVRNKKNKDAKNIEELLGQETLAFESMRKPKINYYEDIDAIHYDSIKEKDFDLNSEESKEPSEENYDQPDAHLYPEIREELPLARLDEAVMRLEEKMGESKFVPANQKLIEILNDDEIPKNEEKLVHLLNNYIDKLQDYVKEGELIDETDEDDPRKLYRIPIQTFKDYINSSIILLDGIGIPFINKDNLSLSFVEGIQAIKEDEDYGYENLMKIEKGRLPIEHLAQVNNEFNDKLRKSKLVYPNENLYQSLDEEIPITKKLTETFMNFVIGLKLLVENGMYHNLANERSNKKFIRYERNDVEELKEGIKEFNDQLKKLGLKAQNDLDNINNIVGEFKEYTNNYYEELEPTLADELSRKKRYSLLVEDKLSNRNDFGESQEDTLEEDSENNLETIKQVKTVKRRVFIIERLLCNVCLNDMFLSVFYKNNQK